MPLYDYECKDHGYFELRQRMADHAKGVCPTCGSDSKQVMLGAPGLDIESMADAGMPGAFMTSGDRMEKRHKNAGQDHHYWRDDVKKKDAIKSQEHMAGISAWDR